MLSAAAIALLFFASPVFAGDHEPSDWTDWQRGETTVSALAFCDLTANDLRRLFGSAATVTDTPNGFKITLKSGAEAVADLENGRLKQIRFAPGLPTGARIKASEEFYDLVAQKNAKAEIFRPNPYVKEEREALALEKSGQTAPVHRVDACSLNTLPTGLTIVGDAHGEMSTFLAAKRMIETQKPDFFGIEMIPNTQRDAVEDFMKFPESDERFKAASERLLKALENWQGLYPELPDRGRGVNNPYYQLLVAAKKNHVRIVPLDVGRDYYEISDNASDTAFGTRNVVWASQLPKEGRGLILGGGAHLMRPPSATIAEAYHARAPQQKITVATPGESCPRSASRNSPSSTDTVPVETSPVGGAGGKR